MTTDLQDLGKTVFLGAEAERFLASAVGKRMVERAEAIREEAVEAFARMNPADTAKVMEVQMQLRMADYFQRWIADMLIEGQEAERQVELMSEIND